MQLPADYRKATLDDAPAMAELVNIAGEGLPLYVWTSMAGNDRSPWDVGMERAKREAGAFSYRNTIVREEAGSVIASLVGYSLEDDPEPVDYSDMPKLFIPLQQLEDLVPGTWYVNVLATLAHARGRGIGSELLTIAEGIARTESKRGLSVVVSDSNTGARRLYERLGYAEIAQREMVKEGWINDGKNWVLLVKNLTTTTTGQSQ